MTQRIRFHVWPVSKDLRSQAQREAYERIEQARSSQRVLTSIAQHAMNTEPVRNPSWLATVLPFLGRRQAS